MTSQREHSSLFTDRVALRPWERPQGDYDTKREQRLEGYASRIVAEAAATGITKRNKALQDMRSSAQEFNTQGRFFTSNQEIAIRVTWGGFPSMGGEFSNGMAGLIQLEQSVDQLNGMSLPSTNAFVGPFGPLQVGHFYPGGDEKVMGGEILLETSFIEDNTNRFKESRVEARYMGESNYVRNMNARNLALGNTLFCNPDGSASVRVIVALEVEDFLGPNCAQILCDAMRYHTQDYQDDFWIGGAGLTTVQVFTSAESNGAKAVLVDLHAGLRAYNAETAREKYNIDRLQLPPERIDNPSDPLSRLVIASIAKAEGRSGDWSYVNQNDDVNCVIRPASGSDKNYGVGYTLNVGVVTTEDPLSGTLGSADPEKEETLFFKPTEFPRFAQLAYRCEYEKSQIVWEAYKRGAKDIKRTIVHHPVVVSENEINFDTSEETASLGRFSQMPKMWLFSTWAIYEGISGEDIPVRYSEYPREHFTSHTGFIYEAHQSRMDPMKRTLFETTDGTVHAYLEAMVPSDAFGGENWVYENGRLLRQGLGYLGVMNFQAKELCNLLNKYPYLEIKDFRIEGIVPYYAFDASSNDLPIRRINLHLAGVRRDVEEKRVDPIDEIRCIRFMGRAAGDQYDSYVRSPETGLWRRFKFFKTQVGDDLEWYIAEKALRALYEEGLPAIEGRLVTKRIIVDGQERAVQEIRYRLPLIPGVDDDGFKGLESKSGGGGLQARDCHSHFLGMKAHLSELHSPEFANLGFIPAEIVTAKHQNRWEDFRFAGLANYPGLVEKLRVLIAHHYNAFLVFRVTDSQVKDPQKKFFLDPQVAERNELLWDSRPREIYRMLVDDMLDREIAKLLRDPNSRLLS